MSTPLPAAPPAGRGALGSEHDGAVDTGDEAALDGSLDGEVVAVEAGPPEEGPVDGGPEGGQTALRWPLTVDGTRLRDPGGHTVILRGVNVAGNAKVPPFAVVTSATLLDPLVGWGLNALRLLFTWEAFEPERDLYDEGYLAYYEQVCEWAAERGLSVLVDFHQDAFSRYSLSGCGEGFPAWAIAPELRRQQPDNTEACKDWGTKMVFDSLHRQTWRRFHANAGGARTKYVEMVRRVAERLAKHPNVIGYDLINEPWGDDAELMSLFVDVGSALRQAHASALLFVPPHALVSSGLVTNDMAKPALDNVVYAPHHYDANVLLNGAWTGNDPKSALDTLFKTGQSWNAPFVLSEFGAPASTRDVQGYLDAVHTWLDAHLVSSMQWNYTPGWTNEKKDGWNGEDLSIVDGAGRLRENFVPRAYPQRVAGTPLEFSASPSELSLTWQAEGLGLETELYLPEGYADGKQLEASPGVDCTLDAAMLRCTNQSVGRMQVQLH